MCVATVREVASRFASKLWQNVVRDLATAGAQSGASYSLLDHLKLARTAPDGGSGDNTSDASRASDGRSESEGNGLRGSAESRAPGQHGDAIFAPESVQDGSAWVGLEGEDSASRVAVCQPSTMTSAAFEGHSSRQDGSGVRRRSEVCINMIPTPSPPAESQSAWGCHGTDQVGRWPPLLEDAACAGDGVVEHAGAEALRGLSIGQSAGAAVADHVRVEEKTSLLSRIATRDGRIRELEAALRSQEEQEDELRLLQEARSHLNLVSKAANVRARVMVEVAARAWHRRIEDMGRALRRLESACCTQRRLSRAVIAMSAQRQRKCLSYLFTKWQGLAGRSRFVLVLQAACLSRRPHLFLAIDRCGRGGKLSPALLALVLLSDLSRSQLIVRACGLKSCSELSSSVA